MEDRIKYWLLTTEFPPFFGGGISTYCRETVRMLQHGGYELTVFLPDRSVTGTVCAANSDCRVIRFNPWDYPEKDFLGYETLVSYAFAKTLEKYITLEGPPSFLESQEYNGIAYFTLLFRQLLYPAFERLNILITVHAPSFVCLPYNHVATYRIPYFWIGEMEKFCLKAADLVISPSDYMAAEIRRAEPRLDMTYTRLVNPYYLPDTRPAGAEAIRRKEFVFYGKTSPLKGVFELLQQFKDIWEEDPEIRLRLVGGVDYYYHPEEKLMGDIIKSRYAKYLESRQLLIEGEIDPGQLRERIVTAHAIIIPSRVDNLPYAVIECMALGKIILASLSGGHRELMEDGKNGFLFSHEAGGSFREKIAAILAMDGPAIDAMGACARESIRVHCDPAWVLERKKGLLAGLSGRQQRTGGFPFLRPQKPPAVFSEKTLPVGEQGLLSVVVPYYNMGAYVEETISSILRSDYPAIEIVLVNDGSDDEPSVKKLLEFQAHPAIRIIHQKNEGLSGARNTGALAARGEFLAFLDPDDTVAPSYYPQAIKVLLHYDNVYFTGAWTRYFGNAEGVWPCFTPEPPFILYHNMVNTSALVYKKEGFLRYGLNDKAMLFGMEDYDSLLNLLENGCNGIALPEPLFNYRVRKGSMARQFTPGKILYLYQLLADKHNKFYSNFAAEIANLLNSNGQGFLHDNPSLDLHVAVKSRIIRKIIGAKGIEYIRKNKRLKKAIIQIQQIIKR